MTYAYEKLILFLESCGYLVFHPGSTSDPKLNEIVLALTDCDMLPGNIIRSHVDVHWMEEDPSRIPARLCKLQQCLSHSKEKIGFEISIEPVIEPTTVKNYPRVRIEQKRDREKQLPNISLNIPWLTITYEESFPQV